MNVLAVALGVIARQPVHLLRFAGNVRQPTGVDLPTYATPVAILGSVQAVPRTNYEALGLDFGKDYVNLYTTVLVRAIERDGSGDVFAYAGRYYHAQDRTDWMAQDGWNDVLAVQIPPLAPAQVVA